MTPPANHLSPEMETSRMAMSESTCPAEPSRNKEALRTFMCDVCGKMFKTKRYLFVHVKNKTCKNQKKITYPRKCDKCGEFYPHKVVFSNHLRMCGKPRKKKPRRKYDGPEISEKFHFSDEAAFQKWKEETELDTFSYFYNRPGKKTLGDKTYVYYTCQFNPQDKTRKKSGAQLRKPFVRGRLPHLVCPARMKVFVQEGGVDVTFYSTHNHPLSEDNVKFQPVKPSLRAELERQLLRGIPRHKILENVRQCHSEREVVKTKCVTMRYLSRVKYNLKRQGRLDPAQYDYISDDNEANVGNDKDCDNMENENNCDNVEDENDCENVEEYYPDECNDAVEQILENGTNETEREERNNVSFSPQVQANTSGNIVVIIDCRKTDVKIPPNVLTKPHETSTPVEKHTKLITTANSILFIDTPKTRDVESEPKTETNVTNSAPSLEKIDSAFKAANANFCVQCAKKFSKTCNLAGHERTIPPAKLLCEKCNGYFSSKKSLYEHNKRNTCTVVKSKIHYPRSCEKCYKIFSGSMEFSNHKRSCGTTPKLKKNKCLVEGCDEMFFKRVAMIKHVQTSHELQIEKHEFEFSDWTEFERWKEEMELWTFSYFSNKSGKLTYGDKKYFYFSCQFDQQENKHIKADVPFRKKLKRGCVPNLGCPARIAVSVLKDKVKVTYYATHNHALELENVKYQRIKPSMQAKLKEQLGLGLKPREIVRKLKEQLEGEPPNKNSFLDASMVARARYQHKKKLCESKPQVA